MPPIIFYYRQWQAPMERAALRTPAGSSPGHSALCWDGKLLREIPRLRVKPGARLNPATVKTGYADMAIESWRLFDRLQQEGVIPAGVKFQISLPTPIAPTYNNMVPTDRPALIPVLTTHLLGEVAAIARALPSERHRAAVGRVPGGHRLGGLLRAGAGRFPEGDGRRADRDR